MQAALPELSAEPTDRLFFAIFPPAAAARQVERLQRNLRARHTLSGRPIALDRLHVTLCHLGDYSCLPRDIVDKASASARDLSAAPFDVMFDRAGSFAARLHKPLVLAGTEGVVGVEALQRALGESMTRCGLGSFATPCTPHMTLLHDDAEVPMRRVEPVEWTVTEITLVRSLLGQSRHLPLGRWKLEVKS